MKLLLPYILMILGGVSNAQDYASGLYFIEKVEEEANCLDPVKLAHSDSTYCLTGQPLIESSQFEEISEIMLTRDAGYKHFSFRLSQSSIDQLTVIEEKEFADFLGLVVNNKLIGKVEVSETTRLGGISVGKGFLSSELKRIRAALVEDSVLGQ